MMSTMQPLPNNSALRRRCRAYRRRQNLYAKNVQGLQRTVTVQRFLNYFRRTEVIMTVMVALAIKVKASCTTHWVAC